MAIRSRVSILASSLRFEHQRVSHRKQICSTIDEKAYYISMEVGASFNSLCESRNSNGRTQNATLIVLVEHKC